MTVTKNTIEKMTHF